MSNLQIKINPQELHGIWRAGYALDSYSVEWSERTRIGERTEMGDLVELVKYRKDRSQIQPLAEIAAKFVREEFVVGGHPVLPHISAIIPMPPSKTNRPFQPVSEIAEKMGSILNLSVRTDYLVKVKPTAQMSFVSIARRPATIQGVFNVQSQDLQEHCVLLFDDVYQTGTTLTEAANVLHSRGGVTRRDGASRVFVLTLTRTYQDSNDNL